MSTPPHIARAAVALLLLPIAGGIATAADRHGCGTVVVPSGVGMNPTPAPVGTLHPILYTGSLYESEAFNLLYRPLVWVNNDHAIDWNESLAAAITPNATRTAFRVTMRPWHWSDGAAVTAGDVAYAWTLIRTLGPAYTDYLAGGVPNDISAVRVVDPRTIEFDTRRPVNPEWFEVAGLTQFYALPRQIWETDDLARQQTLQSSPTFYRVVDGPFRLRSLSLGRNAVFVPNDRYDGHRPSIGRLVMDFLGGTNPLETLLAHQLDIASVPFDLIDATRPMTGFRRVSTGKLPLFYEIIPNLANPAVSFFNDVRVRQAIARAIDQQHLIDVVYHGFALPQHGFVPTAMTDYLAPELRGGHSALDYDPDAARALLDRAGYAPGPDGVRVGHGHRLAFEVLVTAGAEERLLALQMIQADLRRVGIAVSIKEVEFNQLLARMIGAPSAWSSVYIGETILTYPDPTPFFATGATQNYEHYADKEMDRLLDAATGAPDRSGFYKVEMYALSQQPNIFLPGGSYLELTRPGIDGIERFLNTTGLWSPEYLTLRGSMACDVPHA